jgi:hypothetical protein
MNGGLIEKVCSINDRIKEEVGIVNDMSILEVCFMSRKSL